MSREDDGGKMDIVKKLREAVGNPPEMARLFMREGADEIERLREALRKQAVVSRHRMASGGGSIPVGFSCEICEADCDMGQPLIHVGDCPLTVLNPSQ